MPLFYVKIRKNIDICNYLPIYYPAICRGWGTFSVPSLGEGWDGACCLRRGYYVSSSLFFAFVRGEEINTKSRVVDGGFALAWTVAPTVGKRVFLRVVSTIPTVMRCMTPSAATVKKSGLRPFKKSGFRRYKNSCPCNPDYHAGHNTYGLILFSRREPGFFYRRRRTFCICSFSACLWAGAPGWGGEYPRACSRGYFRFTLARRGEALKSCKSFCVILHFPFVLYESKSPSQ